MEDYVLGFIPECVRAVQKDSGETDVNIIGYCAGGMAQLITLIEINVGKDLQYIRFNGSLIGGLAGLALYTGEMLLRLL